jgi:uncharacterized membrane protein YidH (DUF202 family)
LAFGTLPSFENRTVVVEVKSSERQLSMETNGLPKLDNVIFGEIQVLLAEKRTALASLRTGIAVFALPLSVLSALIATSRYYSMEKVVPLLAPLLLLNLGLVVLGTWLVFRSLRRIHHYENRIRELSEKYRSIAEFIE